MSEAPKKQIAIIGGGAAALYLAARLDTNKFQVAIYEKNKALGRKFLVAGKGGFNLTHSEDAEILIQKYTPPTFLSDVLTRYSNLELRTWLEDLDIPTYQGSSKRIFPVRGMKPIEVLQKFLDRLNEKNIEIHTESAWTGWSERGQPLINEAQKIIADHIVFALGGASWKVTGSDGSWLSLFHRKKIKIKAFQAANCAYKVNWPPEFIEKHAGQPLKNISVRQGNKTCKGELVITELGVEGNAVYALSPELRQQLKKNGLAKVHMDLKPTLTKEQILGKLDSSSKNTSETLRRNLKLSPAMLTLLKDIVPKEQYMDNKNLAQAMKNLPLELLAAGPIDKAISTVGGIDLDEVDENFQMKKLPRHYCIGEMLDWDAPTGGYLLQACYSMGAALAEYLNEKK